METKNKKLHTKIVKPTAFAAIGATMIATGVANTETITHIFSGDDGNVEAAETAPKSQKMYINVDSQPKVVFHIENPQRSPEVTDGYLGDNGQIVAGPVNVVGKSLADSKENGKTSFSKDKKGMNRFRFDATNPIRKGNAKGDIIWCIQSGVPVNYEQAYTKNTTENNKKHNEIGVVAYHGYHKEFGQKDPTKGKSMQRYVYTMRYIQELGEPDTIGKEKIVGISGYHNVYNPKGHVMFNFNPKTHDISPKGYENFKKEMNQEMKVYREGPKLENTDNIRPGSTVKVKDKNGALDRYDITGTPKGVKAKVVDKNTLEVTASKDAENGNIEFTYKVPKKYNEVPIMYKLGKDDQNLSNGRIGKKTQTKLNVGVTPPHKPELKPKVDQHGDPVEGAIFKVTNHEDGTTTEVTTDKDGIIEFEGYEGDKVTIEEIQPPVGYILSPEHTKFDITLTENGTNSFEPFNPKSEYLGTKARNDENNSQQFVPEEKVNLKDEIEYANLDTNQEYTAVGWLMDKSTGEPLLDKDGNKVEVSKQLKPEKKDGTFEVDFEFNASDLRGKELVAFEELYIDSTLVAEHKDINDKEQTVRFTDPKISTTALNVGAFDEKKSDPNEDAKITDTVEYDDLTVGDNHRLSGVLMDKETGKPVVVDGKEVRASKEFKTEQAKGSIDVDFFFDANDLKGKDLVVFEKLERQNSKTGEWYEIAKHEDIEDEGQTVHINDPRISLDKEVSKEVYQRGDILTYTFTVTNPGDVVMKNIKFTDEMFKDFEIPFDELEPGQTETFTIDYTVSKKDVHKNYLYNEADITGETPDGWEEKDKDNVISTSDKEIKIVETPKDCNTCNFPNVVVDIKNKNTLNGVIDNEGKFISKDKLSKEEVKEAENVIKEQPKEQPKKEQHKGEIKVAEKEQPKKEKEKEETPELAETGIHNPGNQALIVSLALALLGGAGFLFARSRKNKNEQ